MSDAAQKIAERVPLPEAVAWVDYGVMAKFAFGPAYNGQNVAVTLRHENAEGDIALYTSAQLRAYGLAVAAEALRGAEAVGTVRSDTGVTLTVDRTGHYYGARIPSGTKLYTAPPAGSVEVTDAMVERAFRAYYATNPFIERSASRMRAALYAALQEPEA